VSLSGGVQECLSPCRRQLAPQDRPRACSLQRSELARGANPRAPEAGGYRRRRREPETSSRVLAARASRVEHQVRARCLLRVAQVSALVKPDAVKDTISRGLDAGTVAYVGRASGGDMNPSCTSARWVRQTLRIADDVYLILRERADEYVAQKPRLPSVRWSAVARQPRRRSEWNGPGSNAPTTAGGSTSGTGTTAGTQSEPPLALRSPVSPGLVRSRRTSG